MRAFIDDLKIMSSTICGAKSLLSHCTVALKRAGLTFRAEQAQGNANNIKIIKHNKIYIKQIQ